MGRAYAEPKKHRNKFGAETGNYYAYHPRLKKQVSTGTPDYATAKQIQNGWIGNHSPYSRGVGTSGGDGSGSVGEVTALYTEHVKTEPTEDVKPEDLIDRWADKVVVQDESSESTTPEPVRNDPRPNNSGISLLPTPFQKPSPKGITPEQAAKIAVGLKKIATNLNIIVDAYVVKSMGVSPAKIGDDEIELLQLGWEMVLDEYLTKNKPKPIHVLIAGNVMVLAAMYMHGESVKKPSPVPKPGEANNVQPIRTA